MGLRFVESPLNRSFLDLVSDYFYAKSISDSSYLDKLKIEGIKVFMVAILVGVMGAT
ncbi:Uncharacterised protein [Streptococcus acidominimus]|uniref:Uncharacterized protein n=1 Tax=Streptococcus acidominimus TaxID=1326 RepID=A0A239XLH0_STRAI|nr:hypothetical protein [Streptococcus acidominimus]SNV47086.1 Uncharacterised protein [Streptococcus acidominimus]